VAASWDRNGFCAVVAAILWKTHWAWYWLAGIRVRHTLIGSIIGVGITNQLMERAQGNQRRGIGATLVNRVSRDCWLIVQACCCW